MDTIHKLRLFQSTVRQLVKAYYYDAKRFYKYAMNIQFDTYSANRLLGFIIAKYHVIEKGLTMPKMKHGFGLNTVEAVIYSCNLYFDKFDVTNCQLKHAVNVLVQYREVHDKIKFILPETVINNINLLSKKVLISSENQLRINKATYFKNIESQFDTFAYSRHSVRNFSEINIESEKINNALKLAQDTTPTSCNRQSIRLYVISDKTKINQLLDIQTGNRGFGHLTNKLIVISSEISVYNEIRERNLSFIDSGIYAMNLLYALHFNQIGACALNWSSNIEADINLRNILNIPDSEVLMLLIACGIPADEFKLANSKRFDYKDITTYI